MSRAGEGQGVRQRLGPLSSHIALQAWPLTSCFCRPSAPVSSSPPLPHTSSTYFLLFLKLCHVSPGGLFAVTPAWKILPQISSGTVSNQGYLLRGASLTTPDKVGCLCPLSPCPASLCVVLSTTRPFMFVICLCVSSVRAGVLHFILGLMHRVLNK